LSQLAQNIKLLFLDYGKEKNTKIQQGPKTWLRELIRMDFLNIKDTCSEHDLEAAILRELESFLLDSVTDLLLWLGRNV